MLDILGKALYKTLPVIGLWWLGLVILAIIGCHIAGGHVLVNGAGEADTAGIPNRFNYNDFYHSLVLTVLGVFREQWEELMLKEYAGVNSAAVGWGLVVVFLGCIILTNYLIGSFMNAVDHVLSERKDEEEGK